MLKIYAVKLEKHLENAVLQLLPIISSERVMRINKYRLIEDIHRSIISELLLKYIYLKSGYKNENFSIKKNNFGKPYLVYPEVFQFNVSHSGNWVVCAISNDKVGVDIEKIKPIDLSVADRFFTKQEYNDIMRNEPIDRSSYFIQLWTLKESYIKARGRGLSIPLNSFTISKNRNGKYAVCNVVKGTVEDHRNFFIFDIDEMYKSSVCTTSTQFINPYILREPDIVRFFK